MGFAARTVCRSPHDRDDVSIQSVRRIRRRRSAVLRGAIPARVAAPVVARGNAHRAVRHRLVEKSARRAVDLLGAVQRGTAGARARASAARGGQDAVVRSARSFSGADAGVVPPLRVILTAPPSHPEEAGAQRPATEGSLSLEAVSTALARERSFVASLLRMTTEAG